MKKLFSTLVISTSLLLSATAAFADNRIADHRTDRRPEPPPQIMIKPAPPVFEQSVLDSQRAFGRRGTLTLSARGAGMKKNLLVLSTDDRLDIRFVKITYAGGRSVMLRGSQARVLDLPDGGRIRSVEVSYVNRGARGAMVKLIARGGERGNRHDRWDNDGRFDG